MKKIYYKDKPGFVYIVGNWRNSVLYIGSTINLQRRIMQHKQGTYKGFTSKYNAIKLLYFEHSDSLDAARKTEEMWKNRNRAFKEHLIDKGNPEWNDLTDSLF